MSLKITTPFICSKVIYGSYKVLPQLFTQVKTHRHLGRWVAPSPPISPMGNPNPGRKTTLARCKQIEVSRARVQSFEHIATTCTDEVGYSATGRLVPVQGQ